MTKRAKTPKTNTASERMPQGVQHGMPTEKPARHAEDQRENARNDAGSLEEETLSRDAPYNKTYGIEKDANPQCEEDHAQDNRARTEEDKAEQHGGRHKAPRRKA
jgi:hypothetical protein